MTEQDLIIRLLALPDTSVQKQFLQEHASVLDSGVADALKRQADRFLRSDLNRSLETADLLYYMAELVDNPLYKALGLLAEANVRCHGLGDDQQAVNLYDEAASIYQQNSCIVRQARSQIGKIFALSRLGRDSEALEAGEWARGIFEEHAEWRLLADATLNMGIVRSRLGEDAESLALYDRARDLYEGLGEAGQPFLPWIDHDRAIALRNLGQFEASLQAAKRAEEMLNRLGQRVEAVRARQNLALTYFVLGRYNEALELYDQVRDAFVADGRKRDAILVDLYTSDCLLQLRRFGDVLLRCRRIRERFTELGTHFEAGQALLNEAVAYAGLNRYAEAIASLAEARRLFVGVGNQAWIACADLEKAALLLRQRQFEESQEAARTSVDVFHKYGLAVKEAKAHLIAARAATFLGQRDQALELITEVLGIVAEEDIPSLEYQSHYLLGNLAVDDGNVHGAMVEYEQAIQAVERLRGRLMVEFRADFLEDKQVVYEDMVRLCLDTDQPLRALEYAERAKSRSLLDLLAYQPNLSVQARNIADRPLVEELMRLRSDRDRLYRRWESPSEPGEEDWASTTKSRQQARQDILALEKQITDGWHRLLIRNADYACDAALWQVRTEAVQPYLASDTLLIEYYVVGQQIIVFLVMQDMIRVQWLSSDLGQVRRLLQRFLLNLKAVPRSSPDQILRLNVNAKGLLQQLHTLLVAPLTETLTAYEKLTVVPHSSLHYVPFHALYDGDAFLLEQYEISYLPASSFLRYCHKMSPVAAGQLVIGHSCGGRLPYAVKEANTIATILGDRAILEDDATLTKLREVAPNSKVIHLAAHGAFRMDNPLFSGLALADGWLTTLDVFNLHLSASLVTLSACETGRNVIGGGDELLGLMRAFLYAGAASLLLSLWTTEDSSSAELMESFYRKLTEGEGKRFALRYAQQQFIDLERIASATTSIYAHPYYWAPFFLVGSTESL